MDEGIKKVSEDTLVKDSEFKNDELLAQREKNRHQKTLFFGVLVSSAILMVIALYSAISELMGEPSTQEVAILALMVTAPIVLILALMRYIYDGQKSDSPQPTLLLNVGKELAGVIQGIFKK